MLATTYRIEGVRFKESENRFFWPRKEWPRKDKANEDDGTYSKSAVLSTLEIEPGEYADTQQDSKGSHTFPQTSGILREKIYQNEQSAMRVSRSDERLYTSNVLPNDTTVSKCFCCKQI